MTGPGDGPRPRAVAELDPASPWCQRWTLTRQHSWQHLSEGGFDARRYIVEPIGETAGRDFVRARRYSGTWPAAARRYGLFDLAGELLGVCVLGIPISAAVLTNVFCDLEPMVEALELSRLVRADEVPGNAETAPCCTHCNNSSAKSRWHDLSHASIRL